jgi:uncharacterized protein YkwD
MKPAFLICFSLLSFGGISTMPAIAADSYPTSATRQLQVPLQTISQAMKSRASFEGELLRLTNLERQKVGLAPLKLSLPLTRAAQLHSTDMARNSYFSHTGQNGSSMADRAKATGYKYSYLGENLAAGKATPEGTIRQWMNSSGHRANILNRNFTEIGFGYENAPNSRYKNYWVQVFGTPQR